MKKKRYCYPIIRAWEAGYIEVDENDICISQTVVKHPNADKKLIGKHMDEIRGMRDWIFSKHKFSLV